MTKLTIEELTDLIKNTEVGPDEIAALNERLDVAEKAYEEQDRRRRVDTLWLNRSYNM